MPSKIDFQTGKNVWLGPDMKQRENEWIFHVTDLEIKEIEVAVDLVLASAEKNSDILPLHLFHNLEKFNLPILDARIKQFLNQLNDGLGFLLWKGFPVQRWSHRQTCAAFLLIGRCLGNVRQQNASGHVLGHVRDIGVRTTDPTVRVYQTNERQTFHTDFCDIVGLLCLKTAKSGGLSAIASSSAVFNEMLKIDPASAEELMQPMPMDKRGEVVPGMKPFWEIPVFHKNIEEGYLSAIYHRMYINSSQRFPNAPRLTKEQVKALDLFDKLTNDPKLHFTMELQPGDVQFVNNHVILHDRTAFTDWDQEDRKRHLLRVWVAPKKSRPLPDVYTQVYGSVTVGDRGGWTVPGVPSVALINPTGQRN